MSLLDRARRPDYNCAHYAAELWSAETGQDIRPLISAFAPQLIPAGAAPSEVAAMGRVPAPRDPCVVLFRRGTSTHIGVFLRGRVQHLAHLAPIRQPLEVASLGFNSVRFYAPC